MLPRILLVPLLISLWIAPGAAQSPQKQAPLTPPNPFAAQPMPGSRIAPLDFHSRIQGPAPNPSDGAVHRLTSPPILKQFDLFGSGPNALHAPAILIARSDARCYTIRDYRFSRVSPDSDATRLGGSSTCESASQVHLKDATAR
jgi:hypothetical protein